jgi:hypothetical protein
MKNRYFIALLISSLTFSSLTFAQLLETNEGFDDVENLNGWVISNQSVPLGDSDWFQGSSSSSIMVAQNGDLPNSFIAANHRATGGETGSPGIICDYLIMPEIGNVESISFYTRSRVADNNFNIYPDRLYLVYSPTGEITPGNCTDGFGDFTETLVVVNPDLLEVSIPDGYPLNNWGQYSSEVNGSGRLAFVYYVTDAGLYGSNSNYIGLDTVEWVLAPLADNQLIFTGSFE